MTEILLNLSQGSIPTILVIAGLGCILLWVGVEFNGSIHVPPSARRTVGAIGAICLIGGIFISLSPSFINQNILPTPTQDPLPSTSTIEVQITTQPNATMDPISTPSLASTAIPQPALFLDNISDWARVSSDSFNDNSNKWLTDEQATDDQDKAKIAVNGKYYIDITTTDGTQWWPFYSDVKIAQQFFLEINVQRTKSDGCFSGIVWETVSGYYSFRIDDIDQEYSLTNYNRLSDRNYYDQIKWTKSDLIKSGDINRLSVINDGYNLYLYVNGSYLAQSASLFTANGRVGIQTAVCNANSQVTFEFDNLDLRMPPASFFAQDPAKDEALQAFTSGVTAFLDRKYSLAVENFQESVSKDHSQEATTLYFLGRALSANNNPAEAIKYYSQSLEKGYVLPSEVYNRRGLAYMTNQTYDLAIEDFSLAIAANHPNIGWVYHNRGDANRESDKFDDAIKDYSKAIEKDYNSSYRKRGWVFVELKRYDEAIADYTTAIEKGVNDYFLLYDRGVAHQGKGDKERAIADFENFIETEAPETWKEDARRRINSLQQ